MLEAEVEEWAQLVAACEDASPKARIDALKGLQAKRQELHTYLAAVKIRGLDDVEQAARERSTLALADGSHVAALGHAKQAEQERLAREERQRQRREQELARETPDSALLLLGERLRALPAGQLRRLLDAVCPALHLAPGVPCVACGRPTPEPTPDPAAGPGAPVVAVPPPVVGAPPPPQAAPGPRAAPQTTQGPPSGPGAATGAPAPARAAAPRVVVGAPPDVTRRQP